MSTATVIAIRNMKMYRECLGKFATGVTVVSCRDAQGNACGITANSFSSASLDPPLVLWNIASVSRSLAAYLEAENFAINVLGCAQRNLAVHFARSDASLFDRIEHRISAYGVPILPHTVATLECRTTQIHETGDHYTIIGEVLEYNTRDVDPLLFYQGMYTSLTPGNTAAPSGQARRTR